MPCGAPHTYQNIDDGRMNKILTGLKDSGAMVAGTNPWTVDTQKHGVKLKGSLDTTSRNLSVEVIDKNFYVPCSQIWDTIDPLINNTQTIV